MDALSMLEHDHRHVESLLSQLSESSPGAERSALAAELSKALELHMRFEEEHIYPLMREIDAELEEEAEVEHGLAREGLQKVNEMIARPGFGAAVEMMTAGIAHHVEDEEEEAFPKLRQAFDADRLSSLGRTLMAEKQTAGMLVDSQSTKAELQEIAGELGIERRSSMTKDELKEAILAVS